MHLQSLELFGFKSFADKTIFNFHEGVTAIVGPNGCGKSNVLDAVRWVLGEQSAKALRGGEMADVIFNGSDQRKPLGFAEVSLTFSNCSQELGVDWHDVRVTRRIYRDGNSDYFLNKTLCRLKDIQSLFADTGVGRSAYSMMEQGKIDLILSSHPEDRRAVFEEAAGITKYRTQKREALRKLEATEANLLRIGDIIKEVKRQIGSLQRQAGKARRYQALLADLRVLDTHHSRQKIDQLEAELENSRGESARLANVERAAQEKIESHENDLAAERRRLDEIDDQISEGRAEVQRLQNEVANHRSRIEFNRQRAQEFEELIARHENDIGAAEEKRGRQETEIAEADALIEKTNSLLTAKEAELTELNERVMQLREEQGTRDVNLREVEQAASKLESRIVALEEERSSNGVRRETTAARIADLEAAITDTSQQREKLQANLQAARATTQSEQANLEKLIEQKETADGQLKSCEETMRSTEGNLAALEREMAEKNSRLEILRQLNEEGEGLEHGSQAVLRGLDDPEKLQPALDGALVSHLDVEPEFIGALEAAFGRRMNAILLQNAELAPRIMATLLEKKLGQAALALPELAKAPAAESPTLPEGALAWAIDKMSAPEHLKPLVRQLLHGVAVVRDLETGLALKKKAPHLQIATLPGEFISSEGIIFGGRAGAAVDSLLERKARINLLLQEVAAAGNRRGALNEELASAREKFASAKQALAETRDRHQDAHLHHSAAAGEIVLIERSLQEVEQKLETLGKEKATLDQQLRVADERIDALRHELETLQERLSEEKGRMVAFESEKEKAEREQEEAAARLNEVRLAVATERQRHDHLLSQREPMAARAAELAELIDARRADIAHYRERLTRQADESRQAEEAIARQTAEGAAAEEKVSSIAAQRSSLLTSVNAQETQLRQLRHSLNDLRDQRGKQEVRQTQLELQIENIAEHVTRRYQVDVRSFERDAFAFEKTLRVQVQRREKAEADLPEAAPLESIIAELTRQLDNMGPVNIDAVQEYDELEERHRFLETQNNDLTSARRELLDVIARINSTSQKLFTETFTQVRANFREMFAELFGGGRADLVLLDENDPLNCGIEISAKPPGKQLQSVSLLSGGERTMTAVALLFAIYMVRPSPFCILDEMDAPLDESNINRFIGMLERFVAQSQFVIITHNKRTIAKADILYGVTMEERGISKLVGMKMADSPATTREASRSAPESKPMQAQFPLGEASNPRSLAASR